MKMTWTLFLILFPFSSMLYAKPVEYKMDPSSWVTFNVPYTLGVHDGKTTIDHVHVRFDPDDFKNISGEVVLPISKMRTGNEERDCHLREALGLNYELSDYPKEHICNDKNELPPSGKNAVIFPDVIFSISGMAPLNNETFSMEKLTDVEIIGQWTIHGVSKMDKVRWKISFDKGRLRISGDKNLNINDFKIKVKSAKFLFATISVSDEIKTHFDLLLEPMVKPE